MEKVDTILAPHEGFAFITGFNEEKYANRKVVLNARRVIGIIWLIAPFLILALGGYFQTGTADGACVAWRPDTQVYIVAWIMLVLCIMFSWAIVSRRCTDNILWASQAVLYFLVILLAIFWMWLYHNSKRNGISVFLFLIMILLILLPLVKRTSNYAFALLLPLLFWACFQLGINAAEMSCIPVTIPVTVPVTTDTEK
jgi:tryptophan-rich sensory protein